MPARTRRRPCFGVLASGVHSWRFVLPVLAGTAGCAPSADYTPHALHSPLAEARRAFGCIDLGFFAARDRELPPASFYLEVHVENRCDEPVLVNLGALRMTAHGIDRSRRPLTFYDPRHQIVPLHAQARREGVERFRIDGAQPPGSLAVICIDPADVVPDAGRGPARPACFDFTSVGSR